jgi:hypothetical protein
MRILFAGSVVAAAFAVYACSADPVAGDTPVDAPDSGQDAPGSPPDSAVTPEAGKDAEAPETCTAAPSTDQPGTYCTVIGACPACAGEVGALRYSCSSGQPMTRILAVDAGPIALDGCHRLSVSSLRANDFCCAPAWVESMPEGFDGGWTFCPAKKPRLYVGPADAEGKPTLPIPPECATEPSMSPVAGSVVAAICCEP